MVSPVLIREELITYGDVFGGFDKKSVRESQRMAGMIEGVCKKYDVNFMDAAEYAEASLVDNIHMDEENHGKLAIAINRKLRKMFLD